MPSPMDPLRRLAELAEGIGKKLGLHLATFAALPSSDGGPDRVQVMYLVEPDAEPVQLEESEADAFEELVSRTREQEREEKVEQAKTDLLGILKDPKKGLFGE